MKPSVKHHSTYFVADYILSKVQMPFELFFKLLLLLFELCLTFGFLRGNQLFGLVLVLLSRQLEQINGLGFVLFQRATFSSERALSFRKSTHVQLNGECGQLLLDANIVLVTAVGSPSRS